MENFFIQNGFLLFVISQIPVLIGIVSLPFYFTECGDLAKLISIYWAKKFQLEHKNSSNNYINSAYLGNWDLDISFKKISSITKNINLSENKDFELKINSIKQYRKIYFRIFCIYLPLVIIFFLFKRLYFSGVIN